MSSHSGQTGQINKVKLDSAIEQVYWTRRQAAPGGTVGLEVFTRYVGNGAELKIELTDNAGKNHGSFTDRIQGNHFWASVKVPADARDALFASARLSKHGAAQKSSPLLLLPPVQITGAKWDRKDARPGDTLKLSADIKGAPDGTEAAVEIFKLDPAGAHELIARVPVAVKDGKLETWWEYGDYAVHEIERGARPPEYMFRVLVGELSADSGPLAPKQSG